MSELTVKGCTLTATVDTSDGTLTCSPTESSTKLPSDYCKVNGKGIYFEKVVAQITSASILALSPPSGATSPTGTFTGQETIDIKGTAEYVLEEGKKAVQKGDKGSKKITFIFPAQGGGTVTGSYEVTVEVTDAGQTDVTAL